MKWMAFILLLHWPRLLGSSWLVNCADVRLKNCFRGRKLRHWPRRVSLWTSVDIWMKNGFSLQFTHSHCFVHSLSLSVTYLPISLSLCFLLSLFLYSLSIYAPVSFTTLSVTFLVCHFKYLYISLLDYFFLCLFLSRTLYLCVLPTLNVSYSLSLSLTYSMCLCACFFHFLSVSLEWRFK